MTERNDFEIRSAALGVFQTNCYTVRHDRRMWIVDAGFEPEALIEMARAQDATVEAIVLTHAHSDHIAGIPAVLAAFPGTPVWIHEAEQAWLGNPELNLSTRLGQPISLGDPDRLLRAGETLTLGAMRWSVRHTPGHSPGSISLVCVDQPVALVGDALFRESVGRTDFPGCSIEELGASIRSQLYTLDDDTVILPGHGPSTTIGHEKLHNPFVSA